MKSRQVLSSTIPPLLCHIKAYLTIIVFCVGTILSISQGRLNAEVLTNIAPLEQFIREAQAEYRVPGVAVSVVGGDKILFCAGFGTTTAGGHLCIDEHTTFQIGSITKTFNAAVLALLAQQGVLEFNDRVKEHLPDLQLENQQSTDRITIEDLLTHRSGLPAFQGELLGDIGLTRSEVLAQLRYLPLASIDNGETYYSNIGYFLTGELAALKAKDRWENLVYNSLILPLGMCRTGFAELFDEANCASAHVLIEGEPAIIPSYFPAILAASGGIVSSAKDMANWMLFFLNRGVWLTTYQF